MAGIFAKCGNPFDQESFRDHENLSLVSSSRTVSRDSTWSLHIDRHTAAIAFNELAARLHLDPLDLVQCYPDKVPALSTPEVFCNEGDLKMAARIYDYFAKQVLSAENVRDRIETTVRRGELPIDLIGMFDHGASHKFSSQVLSVGWVFKALLAGLPGGILGSARLYRVLVNICYGRIAERNKSNGDGGGGLSPPGHTKLQAIGLAVLALTTPMQLNLICAFFGLCAMLQYETERAGVVDELGGDAGRSGLTFGLSSVERLGHVLGPLLTPDGGDGGDGGQDTFRAIEREIENQRYPAFLPVERIQEQRRDSLACIRSLLSTRSIRCMRETPLREEESANQMGCWSPLSKTKKEHLHCGTQRCHSWREGDVCTLSSRGPDYVIALIGPMVFRPPRRGDREDRELWPPLTDGFNLGWHPFLTRALVESPLEGPSSLSTLRKSP
ncbi:hypothetical protein APSETT444_006163 [Aspergillus pseudonomiae]